jgi:regulator of replication initiation timing
MELGVMALRNCTQQRNDAAAMIEENQAINHENTSIKTRLALEKRELRAAIAAKAFPT